LNENTGKANEKGTLDRINKEKSEMDKSKHRGQVNIRRHFIT